MIKKIYLKYEEIINYVIVGGCTTLINLVVYFVLINTIFSAKGNLDIQIANVIAWICSVLFAYVTNRKFVFKSSTKGREKLKEISSFFGSRVVSLIMDIALMFILYSVMHINDTISKLIDQVVIIVANYVLAKLLVFKK